MQGELTFANTAEQFDTGDCDGGVVEVLEAEHGTGSGLDTPMILFDQMLGYFDDRSLVRFHASVGVIEINSSGVFW
jgi:hypothetical protein